MTTPLEIFAANRDLALAEAETCTARGYGNLASHSLGQAVAYSECIRIETEFLSRPAPVEQFRCGEMLPGILHVRCGDPASFVAPDGTRRCAYHAPTDVALTISEHDDQREQK